YNRAATVMELLEERGVVGPQVGTAPREILISRQEDEDEDNNQPGAETDYEP
ncbi:MAG: DNA translocase FtsK, partial [Verrucomicrobiota bacterium]